MKILEIAEQLISAVNSFDNTIGSRINPLQVEGMIPSLRQEAILAKYNGSRTMAAAKRINGDWVQKFSLTIDSSIQTDDAEYILLDCPPPISINYCTSGFIYVGAKDRVNRFIMAQTRDEIATYKARGFINDGKHIVCMYADSQLEIYGNNNLETVYLEMILQNPADKPSFSLSNDEYPVSADILGLMTDIFKQRMGIAISQAPDNIADNADTNTIRVTKSNL